MSLYMAILYEYVSRRDARDVILYYFGSMFNSMLVYLPGAMIGIFGGVLKPAFLLNVPFYPVPVILLLRALATSRKSTSKGKPYPLSKRPIDALFALFFIVASVVAYLRFLAAENSPHELGVFWRGVEVHLVEPHGYGRTMALVQVFYFVPFFILAARDLINGTEYPWVTDMALIYAGAAAHAETCFIIPSFHYLTEAPYMVHCLLHLIDLTNGYLGHRHSSNLFPTTQWRALNCTTTLCTSSTPRFIPNEAGMKPNRLFLHLPP